MNYNLKLDLAKLKNVAVANINGKSGNSVKCVIIPVDHNNIFLSEKGGIYLDFGCFALKKEQYGQSHLVKQYLPREVYEAMTDEERNEQPIVGSLKPMKARKAQVNETAEVEQAGDLPF